MNNDELNRFRLAIGQFADDLMEHDRNTVEHHIGALLDLIELGGEYVREPAPVCTLTHPHPSHPIMRRGVGPEFDCPGLHFVKPVLPAHDCTEKGTR